MLPKTQLVNHQNQMTGVKGFFHNMESAVTGGLKLYGTLKGVYDVGKTVLAAGETVAPIIAGML